MKRIIGVVLQVTLLAGLTTAVIGTAPAHAVTVQSCGGTSFPGNDDNSVGPVALGFTLDFFNVSSNTVFVNNNGNLTFTSANGTFTPGAISGASQPIIAPFWADVDTGVGNVVTYGTTTFGEHAAFCATWPGVGFYSQHTDKLNTFQVILVDRSDVAPGDFDIVFNYQQIQWEEGDFSGGQDGLSPPGGHPARAGYSDGGTNSLEFPGSGVNGGFLDSNPTTGLAHASNDGVPGQFSYQVRNGTPTGDAPTITSDNGTTFTEGTAGSFTVTTTGNPTPAVGISGDFPPGVGFQNNGGGTATISGTPGSGTAGDWPVTLSASNGVEPDASQGFTLTVAPAGGSATLGLTKSGTDPVQEQNPITYTLGVTNSGSGNANDVVLSDTLPAGTTFDQASTPQGSCSFASGTVTCALGTVAPTGESGPLNVTIIVQAPNVTADTTITNNASVSASNAGSANASTVTNVLVNTGGSTSGDVPPDTTVPLTFTTSTLSTSNGQPAVNSGDKTAVSIIVPPGGPGGHLSLDELPCAVAPCTAGATAPATTTASGTIVLGGVVFDVKPPPNYPSNKPFRVTLLYDKTLNPTKGPVYYFKPLFTATEIKLPHCGTTSPNGGKPCVLKNAKITTGPALILGDWKVVVRIGSDPRMHR